MNDLRKAAEMALEALEELQGGCTDSDDGTVEALTIWCPEVIEALRQALAEPANSTTDFVEPKALAQTEQEPVAWMTHIDGFMPLFHKTRETALNWQTQPTPLYLAPPKQPEQEPVVGKGKEFSEQLKLCARNVAFAASGHVDMSSAAMQEMFALIDHVCTGIDSPPALAQPEKVRSEWVVLDEAVQTLRAALAPPKREWVGLTDEEIYDYADKFLYQHGSNYGIRSFGKAIETKLKEKNT